MDVRLHSRNTQLDERFRKMAEDKIGHASRFFESVDKVDVELSEEPNPRRTHERFRVELTSAVAGHVLRIETAADTAEAALDLSLDRFNNQLRRIKERLIDRTRHKTVDGLAPEPVMEVEDAEVVRVKQFVMKPMTVTEASLQMELLGHDFYFFLNQSTDRHSVLYRRRDGKLGLIEPA